MGLRLVSKSLSRQGWPWTWSSASIPRVLRSQCAVRACLWWWGQTQGFPHVSSPTCWRWCRFHERPSNSESEGKSDGIQRSQSWPARPGPPLPPPPPPLPKASVSQLLFSSHSHLFLSLKKQKLGSPKSWKSEFVSENFDIWYYKVLLSQTLSSFGVKARQNGENKIPKRRVLSYEIARWVRMSVLQSGLLLRCDVLLLGMVPEVLTEGGPGQGDASSRVTCWRLVLHK